MLYEGPLPLFVGYQLLDKKKKRQRHTVYLRRECKKRKTNILASKTTSSGMVYGEGSPGMVALKVGLGGEIQ